MPVGCGGRFAQELHGPEPTPESVGGVSLAALHTLNPFRWLAAEQFPSVFVEKVQPDMLGVADTSQVFTCAFFASGLIGLNGLIQKSRLLGLHAGNLAGVANSQSGQDCQHQEKRLRDPVGKKDSDKEASHVSSPRAVVNSPLAWSRGCAKMYPTPRTVLM